MKLVKKKRKDGGMRSGSYKVVEDGSDYMVPKEQKMMVNVKIKSRRKSKIARSARKANR